MLKGNHTGMACHSFVYRMPARSCPVAADILLPAILRAVVLRVVVLRVVVFRAVVFRAVLYTGVGWITLV